MKMGNAKIVVTLLTIAGLMAAAAVTFFLFVPTMKDVLHLSDQIVQAHAELDAQYANRKNLLASLTASQSAHATMLKLATQFVPMGHELDFITAVENLATKDGVQEIVSLTPNEGGTGAAELRESYNLTVNGKYRSVMQMLVDLEKMPTLLLVDNVVVRPGAGATPGEQSFLSVMMHGSLAAPPNGL